VSSSEDTDFPTTNRAPTPYPAKPQPVRDAAGSGTVAAIPANVNNGSEGLVRASFLLLWIAVISSDVAAAQPRSDARRPRPGYPAVESAESAFNFGPWFRYRYSADGDQETFRSYFSRISCGSCRFGRCSDREWEATRRCQERAREIEKKEAEWRRDAEHRRDEFERDMAKREREFRRKEAERYRRHEREMAERWREFEYRR